MERGRERGREGGMEGGRERYWRERYWEKVVARGGRWQDFDELSSVDDKL